MYHRLGWSAGQRGDAARCRQLGVAAYLTKPVGQSELFEAMQRVLGSKTQEPAQPSLITRHSLREDCKTCRILLAEDNIVNQSLAAAFWKSMATRWWSPRTVWKS